MRFLFLKELFFMKQKIQEKKDCWHLLTCTVQKEQYVNYCRLLQNAQIDYRIWMRKDGPVLLHLQHIYQNTACYQLQFDFFVRRNDFKKAYHALKNGTREDLNKKQYDNKALEHN